jgi:hypothetical protein
LEFFYGFSIVKIDVHKHYCVKVIDGKLKVVARLYEEHILDPDGDYCGYEKDYGIVENPFELFIFKSVDENLHKYMLKSNEHDDFKIIEKVI